ncbi:hypothetical protein KSP40_PGU021959 [Platanthera guangdongensis]|uniref:Uncharacterized protein n=1 Tax=Platanthera guangdongensis TaxID=2320717 RepID=A0ABR2N5R8_9ASPA
MVFLSMFSLPIHNSGRHQFKVLSAPILFQPKALDYTDTQIWDLKIICITIDNNQEIMVRKAFVYLSVEEQDLLGEEREEDSSDFEKEKSRMEKEKREKREDKREMEEKKTVRKEKRENRGGENEGQDGGQLVEGSGGLE